MGVLWKFFQEMLFKGKVARKSENRTGLSGREFCGWFVDCFCLMLLSMRIYFKISHLISDAFMILELISVDISFSGKV